MANFERYCIMLEWGTINWLQDSLNLVLMFLYVVVHTAHYNTSHQYSIIESRATLFMMILKILLMDLQISQCTTQTECTAIARFTVINDCCIICYKNEMRPIYETAIKNMNQEFRRLVRKNLQIWRTFPFCLSFFFLFPTVYIQFKFFKHLLVVV